MPSTHDYDVIIIGTGAGGGTLARRLAPSGKRILLLERGGIIPREQENWDPASVFRDRRYLARETWVDQDGQSFAPYTHYCVGGNTKVYGAALLRMRKHDFTEVRHFAGVSPAWPLGYDDFEPYYTEAERLYSVHGRRGADPFEPPASSEFPFPPLEPEPHMRRWFEDLERVGARPFPIPLGIRPGGVSRGEAPIIPSKFDGYPDLTEAKADAHVVGVKHALIHDRVNLLTGVEVLRLETDPGGRTVTRVHAVREGEPVVFRGDMVVVSCGAINSAALLLRSASDSHPRGLANGSDQVGRNYMTHQNGCFIVVSDEPNPSAFQKHFGITDFYCGADDSEFPLGIIQLMGKPDRWTLEWLRGEAMPGVPIEDIMTRTVDFFLTAEDLPSPDNRISLTNDGGIRVSYTRNNTEAYDRLEERLRRLVSAVDATRGRRASTIFSSRLGVSGVSHQNGTLRFGSDPKTSVLNLNCRAHQVDNLYVVDGSFFPSSAAVNPSLTIMANALRVGDHILDRLGTSHAHREPVYAEGAA